MSIRDLEALADAMAKVFATERRERRGQVAELQAEIATLKREIETVRGGFPRVVPGGKAA